MAAPLGRMGTELGAGLGAGLGIGFLVGAAKLAVDPIMGLAITALAANSDKVSGAARKTYARLLNGSAPPQDSNHILFNNPQGTLAGRCAGPDQL